MKGLLCCEFLDFAAGRLVPPPDLAAVGVCERSTCPGPGHLWTWVEAVADHARVPPRLLLQLFGATLFGRIARGYPAFLVGIDSTLDLLARYEAHVADEVRKVDAAAQPAHLELVRREGGFVEVVYRSPYDLADLAEGLLRGCIAYFADPLEIERHDGAGSRAEPFAVTFLLRPRPAVPLTLTPSRGRAKLDQERAP